MAGGGGEDTHCSGKISLYKHRAESELDSILLISSGTSFGKEVGGVPGLHITDNFLHKCL